MNKDFERFITEYIMGAHGVFDIANLPKGLGSLERLTCFMRALAGDREARSALADDGAVSGGISDFLVAALDRIALELDAALNNSEFSKALERALESPAERTALRSVLFPEGVGLPGSREARVEELRRRRIVRISHQNSTPISDPAREILFTSNVLLTVPAAEEDVDRLLIGANLKRRIRATMDEPQLYWFDHPIQIGVAPEANEILYGLRGLESMAAFEIERGNMDSDAQIACALSVSVTHPGLHGVAREYIESEISNAGGFRHLDIYVFTEEDTARIFREVLETAGGDRALAEVFGVDGEYGRHYSFLKALAALWGVARDRAVRATFKIDLDQVFPQRELVGQTGASAFEHFRTALWGAVGIDADGENVELGMIAGALVNERDIVRGIYTPDVPFRGEPQTPEEEIFFSAMLMGLSTQAELMTRYGEGDIDGERECIQRIHVTGGTNGILIDSLRRHRPFTPSFIGRAEDQAYLLSVLLERGPRLRYVHADGLIMRHDKEAFAGDAIKAASLGNLIGDYIRTIYFSRYAQVVSSGDIDAVKRIVDPFTGCFISRIPTAVVMLRFCARALQFHHSGERDACERFIESSWPRLERAFLFATHELADRYRRERTGWEQYYDILNELESNEKLRQLANEIISDCRCSAAGELGKLGL